MWRGSWKAFLCGTLIWVAAGFVPAHTRGGEIQFSNGETITGAISLVSGGELKLQSGNQLHTLPFDQVREIRLLPEKETMERKWQFKEAGQVAKKYEGEPYPIRYLQAVLMLAGNQCQTGHLYTTALLVDGDDKTEKVILPAKQSGRPGESLNTLVYPTRVLLASTVTGAGAADETSLKFRAPESLRVDEVVLLTRDNLSRFEGGQRSGSGEFLLPPLPGQTFFLAVKSGGNLAVGWPRERPETLEASVREALRSAEDFFDDRRLLGIYYDVSNANVYSLLMLARQGKTTLEKSRSQPWRLAVWRWKYQDQRLLLAGQNYFYRGILEKNASPPAVDLSETLWKIRRENGVWVAGGD
jgi:hypothetical protein